MRDADQVGGRHRRVIVAHPSPDLYGSDRQLVHVVSALVDANWQVSVHLPVRGPLVRLLSAQGAAVRITKTPVLRKSVLTAGGIARLAVITVPSIVQLWRLLRRERPDAVYVNTVTIPFWILAGRLAGCPVVCHVREAEDTQSRVVRLGLTLPLLLARSVLTNSAASRRALLDVVPRLQARTRIVYNGMPGPLKDNPAPPSGSPARIALVARLSPRKGIDVALDALAHLLAQHHDVHLDICGTVFPGYEWYETALHERAGRPDLAGHVTFHGYVNPTWPTLHRARVVIVPSRAEPFGNTAVEGLLAHRPVIASNVQGLAEIIDNDRTGLLIPPDDPTALATAIADLLDNPDRATRLADAGHHDANTRFTLERYRTEMTKAIRQGADISPAESLPGAAEHVEVHLARKIFIGHPSPDVYGSDRQLLHTVAGLRAQGWDVVVCVPDSGPLLALLDLSGATTRRVDFPVLRRSVLSAAGLLRLAISGPAAIYRIWRLLRRERPDAVYVNTVTIPFWLAAARLAGCPVVCHVHEAEDTQSRVVRLGLTLPLLLARSVLTNSAASRRALLDVVPRLQARTRIVYNGMPGPLKDNPAPPSGSPARIALVARLSPRKGIDVALDALAHLLAQHHDVHLDICGTVFPGYEWYETALHERAGRPDLAGHVTFHGYVNPTWPTLHRARVVIVPSRAEPFGNTAVEGLLAHRPVIASNVQGLAEIIDNDRTGLLIPPDDPTALATAIADLLDNPDRATRLADAGHHDANTRFTLERYEAATIGAVSEVIES